MIGQRVLGQGPVGQAIVGQVEEPLIRWDWIGDHLDDLWERTVQHVQLTVVSLVLGLAIASVLALVIRRWRWTAGPITAMATLLFAIPSIALFAGLIPLLGTGLAVPTVALTTYSLVVLIPFMVASLDSVPMPSVDAAAGMGLTPRQQLLSVELPLALPTLIGGVRIATVTIIGLVTVGGLFDLGGYGNLIDNGLNRDFPTLIVMGVVLSVLFALVADLSLVALGRILSPWRYKATPR
ncbi:MAG TPA: ABC transporter permease [Microthrixaceae bacterium]|nr:ABC transporter permease [Microthrixaceae bacterium]